MACSAAIFVALLWYPDIGCASNVVFKKRIPVGARARDASRPAVMHWPFCFRDLKKPRLALVVGQSGMSQSGGCENAKDARAANGFDRASAPGVRPLRGPATTAASSSCCMRTPTGRGLKRNRRQKVSSHDAHDAIICI